MSEKAEPFGFIIFAIGLGFFVASEVAGKRLYNLDWAVLVSFILLLWGLDLLIRDKIRTAKEEMQGKIDELQDQIDELKE